MANPPKHQVPMKKIIALSIVAVVLFAAGFAYLWVDSQNPEPLDVLFDIDPFELENAHGGTYVSDNDKIKLITFILVNCPDGVCPSTMNDFTDLQEALKNDGYFGEEVELVAITVDPLRDDAQTLQAYSQSFQADPEGWKFLRGSEEEIESVADDLSYAYHVTEEGLEYHATHMYIVDEQDQVRALHSMSTTSEPMDQEAILADIEQLIHE